MDVIKIRACLPFLAALPASPTSLPCLPAFPNSLPCLFSLPFLPFLPCLFFACLICLPSLLTYLPFLTTLFSMPFLILCSLYPTISTCTFSCLRCSSFLPCQPYSVCVILFALSSARPTLLYLALRGLALSTLISWGA